MQANSGDPDQSPHSVASDLGLHCLPISHKRTLGIYGLKMQSFCNLIRVPEIWEVGFWNNLPSESALGTSDLSEFINMKIL